MEFNSPIMHLLVRILRRTDADKELEANVGRLGVIHGLKSSVKCKHRCDVKVQAEV